MTLPKPTRRPQLGILAATKQPTIKRTNNVNNNNNNKWWKPLVAIRWSSFLIFSLGVGILNLLNSHLVIHHDLQHHNNNNQHDDNNNHMHASSIREILHRHYQKQQLHHHDHPRAKKSSNQHHHSMITELLKVEEEDDTSRPTTPSTEDDESPSTTSGTTAAAAALFRKQQQKNHDRATSGTSHHSRTSAATSSARSTTFTNSHQTAVHRRSMIDFLPTPALNLPNDAFSATWWQSRDRFLHQMQLENIGSVEGACFNAIRQHEDEIRMTVDWLDFSVEHLSRWWKLLQYDRGGESRIAYDRIRNNLLRYIVSAMQHEYEQRTAERQRQVDNPGLPTTWPTVLLRKTIAVIAFMPYTSETQPAWGDAVTMVNLAATMASLARHGCGRIIVVTDENDVVSTNADNTPVLRAGGSGGSGASAGDGDAPSKSFYLIHGAFQLLQEASRFAETFPTVAASAAAAPSLFNTTNDDETTLFEEWFQAANDIMSRVSSSPQEGTTELPPIVRQVAGTEVAFVAVDPNYDYYNDDTNTTETHYLVPKAALEGLKQAMLGKSDHPTRWLGDHAAAPGSKRRLSYWKYIYLTEPDSILQTRPSALAQFAQRAIARRDAILIPHRLQPIPHESDVRGYKDNRYWVPALKEMQHVTLLDAASGAAKTVSTKTTTAREDREHHHHGQDDDRDEYEYDDEEEEEETDACCDGGIHRPKDDYERCGNFWYVCGFQDEDVSVDENENNNYNKTNLEGLSKYKRLFPYSLIRLQHGTGIVSLAATPHGRQCIPTKLKRNEKCPIPPTTGSSISASTRNSKNTRQTSE